MNVIITINFYCSLQFHVGTIVKSFVNLFFFTFCHDCSVQCNTGWSKSSDYRSWWQFSRGYFLNARSFISGIQIDSFRFVVPENWTDKNLLAKIILLIRLAYLCLFVCSGTSGSPSVFDTLKMDFICVQIETL